MRHPLVRSTHTFAFVLAAAVLPAALSAQDIPGGDSPFGLREAVIPLDPPPPPPPPPPGVEAVMPGSQTQVTPKYEFQFIPTALAANGLSTYGAHLGVVAKALLPGRALTVRGGYRRIELAEADDRDRWMAEGRLPVTRGTTRFGTAATLTGEYMHTTVAGSKYKVGAALDQRLWKPIAVGVTGFYVGDETAEGLGVSSSVTYVISEQSRLQLSYRFPNDVETERDYSLTLNQSLFRARGVETRLIVGAARDRAVWATLSFVR